MKPIRPRAGTGHLLPLGSILWLFSVQYFVVQFLVALGWMHSFSLRFNTISDLGNTACGIYGNRLVCSPLHNLMNTSFIMLGLAMFGGSVLIYQRFRGGQPVSIGFGMLLLAGAGTVLVGLFPENTVAGLHILGAGLNFTLGNIALIVLGWWLGGLPLWLRIYSVVSGSGALVALCFFLAHTYGPLGSGGVERIVAYPLTVWLIVMGAYLLGSHRPAYPKQTGRPPKQQRVTPKKRSNTVA